MARDAPLAARQLTVARKSPFAAHRHSKYSRSILWYPHPFVSEKRQRIAERLKEWSYWPLPDSNLTLFGLPPEIRNMIWDYLFSGITYDFKQRVPPNFFAILYTCRQAHQELQTVPMRRSACVAFMYNFQLQCTLQWTFESQLSCLRNLRFEGGLDRDLREFIKVDQDDMRKLTSLEKIEFVGVVSDETKEIITKHTNMIYRFRRPKPKIEFVQLVEQGD